MFELKNIKINRRLSGDTIAFTASAYWRGKRIGTVRNSGYGASHEIESDSAVIAEIAAYCAALPPVHFQGVQLERDIWLVMDEIVTAKWNEGIR